MTNPLYAHPSSISNKNQVVKHEYNALYHTLENTQKNLNKKDK